MAPLMSCCRDLGQGGSGGNRPFLAEVSTFQLEFAYLARASGDHSFLDPVASINEVVGHVFVASKHVRG
jgi:hypothetical protein